MIDYSKLPNRSNACIDISCMVILNDLDVKTVPIAVVGSLDQKGSVALAASPAMNKRFRVKTGTRLFEIPNSPEIRLFEPKMGYFLNMSMSVTETLHKYLPAEAVHDYWIDESLLVQRNCGVLLKKRLS